MRILEMPQLAGWRPLEMNMDVEVQPFCPACLQPTEERGKFKRVPLLNIAIIGSIRVGVCDSCGYMGYIDRPKKEWFDAFYQTEWDQQGQKESEEMKIYFKSKPNEVRMSGLIQMLNRIKDKKDLPILDIGCGFGSDLRAAQFFGYKDIVGIESSKHRAEVVQEALKFPVITGNFEDVELPHKRYGIIMHHHVLEHVHDPEGFIEKASKLQEPGDLMLLSMPNNVGEPTVGVLMFLPHLHSFTQMSLITLLGRFGYEAYDFLQTSRKDLNIIAIKRDKPQGVLTTGGFGRQGVEKILKGLDLKKGFPSLTKRLVWSVHEDNAKQLYPWQSAKKIKDQRMFYVKQGVPQIPVRIEVDYLFVK